MLPIATIAHALNDRIRFRILSRRGNATYFARLEQAFAASEAVSHVETNPLTGSVLLYHNTSIDELADDALARGLFRVQPHVVLPNKGLDAAATWLDEADRRLRRASQETVDMQEFLFIGLVGASIVQLLRGSILGPASTLLADAISILAVYRTKRAHE